MTEAQTMNSRGHADLLPVTAGRARPDRPGAGRPIPDCFRRRAELLLKRPVDFIECEPPQRPPGESDEFASGDWRDLVAGMNGATLLERGEESLLFRQMNDLKRRAAALQDSLRVEHPLPGLIDQIEAHLEDAAEIRDRLVEINVKLILSIVQRYASADQPLDELVSEGLITLLSVVEKFNPDKGFRFSSYATAAVRHNLHRYFRRRQTQMRRETPLSTLDSHPASPAEEARFSQDELNQIPSLLSQLTEREQYILRRRFGLDGAPPATLQKLADQLHISRERVRQLESRALHRLRCAVKPADASRQ